MRAEAAARMVEKHGITAGDILFSDGNHWKFGWGKGLYNFHEQGPHNFHEQRARLWVTFGPCRHQPKSFDSEMAVAVRKIADAAAKRIYVAMSDGLDSELVARVMLQEKIPFTPLIARFDKDYNKHDIS